MSTQQETFLFGTNGVFIEELYARYLQAPNSVDASWREIFAEWKGDAPATSPAWAPKTKKVIGAGADEAPKADKNKAAPAKEVVGNTLDTVRALQLIHAYRVRGHLLADLDPLQQEAQKYHAELDPANYGFAESDYDRSIHLNGVLGYQSASLREILAVLHKTYCGTMGVEFMHIQFPEQKSWIQERIESARGNPQLTAADRAEILKTLVEIESFEEFVQVKYAGVKRFSIQGGDAAISGLQVAISAASQLGVDEVVIGMPHRGRLNVLTTVMGKPYAEMLSLFQGNQDFPEWVDVSGDVKYHLGASSDRKMEDGKVMHLSLTANPSHLEAVNPVVIGKVRAKQDQKNDVEKSRVLGVMMHGDAAFAGQGSVAEALALSELRGYRTGGSLHLIVNNQIGFTTAPMYSRFTPYPSDVAKAVQAPIFHVNGEDPEAVAFVCKMAIEFRQKFKRDVVVDVICYRKYGHNESDEPMFTQPLMYKKIKEKLPPVRIYANKLIAEGLATEAQVEQEFKNYRKFFEEQYEISKEFRPDKAAWLEGCWSGFKRPESLDRKEPATGVAKKTLQAIGAALAEYPKDFAINSKLKRILETRAESIAKNKDIDWAGGEALAYGSLVKEGFPVRLSGQDCGRGTFSHRHSVLVDQNNEERYVSLNHVDPKQARYEVIDSNLSEFAVLGVEYGYSLAEPRGLTIWEAQFGDFANGAQVIIDQFICSGEVKWLRMSGLVMLLPHGYEGQGPEHSSARIERFLQLCAEDNMQVVNCTTPANFFHALRRQLACEFRKPLIVFSPKSLLRHKMAVSTLEDMDKGTSFSKLYAETGKLVADAKIRRVVITSGKVYYDLIQAREERKLDDVAIIRIEQYYPFPESELKAELKRYKNAEIFWCQEEPENMGAWSFVRNHIESAMDGIGRDGERVRYAGRGLAASPAAGYMKIHTREQNALIEAALAEVKAVKKRA